MISVEDVRTKIENAEKTLIACFNYLLQLKHSDGDCLDAIRNFQPELSDCLYELMRIYKTILADKKHLIREKSTMEYAVFCQDMAVRSRLSKVVKTTIEIGKSLGDAFAWFFYQDNLEELSKHFLHEGTGLFTAGIGGRGEVEFIKSNQNIRGLFALYHGITTMLRIGDFSLYAINAGIVGTGELKTEKRDNKLIITTYISSNIDFDTLPDNNPKLVKKSGADLKATMDEHLTEQLSKQDELLSKLPNSRKINMNSEYEHNLLNELSESNPIIINDDKSMFLFMRVSSYNDLFNILYYCDDSEDLPEETLSVAESIIQSGNVHNCYILNEINSPMRQSRIPVFWWDINDECCRKIYFRNFQIVSVFNPAKLLQHYTEAGYVVVDSGNSREIKLQKDTDAGTSVFENFGLAYDLISYNLMKTKNVVECIDQFIYGVEKGGFDPNSIFHLLIQPHIYFKR